MLGIILTGWIDLNRLIDRGAGVGVGTILTDDIRTGVFAFKSLTNSDFLSFSNLLYHPLWGWLLIQQLSFYQ